MNSTYKDLNWYLKWLATLILIVGTAFNSLGYYPLGPLLLQLGGGFWLIVSIRWREKSLIVTNGVMFTVGGLGLLIHFFK